MKVHSMVEELIAMVEEARSMPLSQSAIINRNEMLDLLDSLRDELPAELAKAAEIIEERKHVIDDAHAEADRIIQMARAEAQMLMSQERVYRDALNEAELMRATNDEEMARKRRELDDYIDAKLAAFEAALVKTLTSVQAGRERTAVRLQSDLNLDEHHDPGNFFGDWNDPQP